MEDPRSCSAGVDEMRETASTIKTEVLAELNATRKRLHQIASDFVGCNTLTSQVSSYRSAFQAKVKSHTLCRKQQQVEYDVSMTCAKYLSAMKVNRTLLCERESLTANVADLVSTSFSCVQIPNDPDAVVVSEVFANCTLTEDDVIQQSGNFYRYDKRLALQANDPLGEHVNCVPRNVVNDKFCKTPGDLSELPVESGLHLTVYPGAFFVSDTAVLSAVLFVCFFVFSVVTVCDHQPNAYAFGSRSRKTALKNICVITIVMHGYTAPCCNLHDFVEHFIWSPWRACDGITHVCLSHHVVQRVLQCLL